MIMPHKTTASTPDVLTQTLFNHHLFKLQTQRELYPGYQSITIDGHPRPLWPVVIDVWKTQNKKAANTALSGIKDLARIDHPHLATVLNAGWTSLGDHNPPRWPCVIRAHIGHENIPECCLSSLLAVGDLSDDLIRTFVNQILLDAVPKLIAADCGWLALSADDIVLDQRGYFVITGLWRTKSSINSTNSMPPIQISAIKLLHTLLTSNPHTLDRSQWDTLKEITHSILENPASHTNPQTELRTALAQTKVSSATTELYITQQQNPTPAPQRSKSKKGLFWLVKTNVVIITLVAILSWANVLLLHSNTMNSEVAMAIKPAKHKADLKTLLQRALQQERQLKLTTPTADNAFDTYRKILSLDPENPKAHQALHRMANIYLDWAQHKLRQGDLNQSWEYLKRGLRIRPGYQPLRALQRTLLKQQQTTKL